MSRNKLFSMPPLLPLPSVLSVPELVEQASIGSKTFLRHQTEYKERFGRPVYNKNSVKRWCHDRLGVVPTQDLLESVQRSFSDWKGLEKLQRLKPAEISLYLSREGLLDEKRIEESSSSGGGLAGLGPAALLGLVPFKTATTILLECVPCPTTRSHLQDSLELVEKFYIARQNRSEHSAEAIGDLSERLKGIFPFLQWVEADHYGNPSWMGEGVRDDTSNPHLRRRIPVVCVMGHIDHGKTTLLDTLQESALTSQEAGHVTQSIRAFTVNTRRSMRSLTEFLEGDATCSSAMRSGNFYPEDITFIDTPGHKAFAEMRLHGQRFGDCILLLVSLEEGVKSQTIEVLNCALQTEKPVIIALNKIDSFSDPQRLTSAIQNVAIALSKEAVDLKLLKCSNHLREWVEEGVLENLLQHQTRRRSGQRSAIPTICISGKLKTNCDLLLEFLKAVGLLLSPKADHSTELGRFQARIVESTIDLKRAMKQEKRKQKMQEEFNFSQQKALKDLGQSEDPIGDPLVLQTIVRSGKPKLGMPFVADMAYGQIVKLTDPWGNQVTPKAYQKEKRITKWKSDGTTIGELSPGCSVGISGLVVNHVVKSGSHIVEVDSLQEAKRIALYRHQLRAFVEMFPERTALLRPMGLPHHFRHLGDYGQLSDRQRQESVEYQMALKDLNAGQSVAAPLRLDNPQDENPEWVALQDPTPLLTQEDFQKKLENSELISVLLRVDTWHSARILAKEIPKLGTKNTMFQITGMKLGQLKKEDLSNPHQRYDGILSYRVPPIQDPSLSHTLETSEGCFYIHTYVLSELIKATKRVAVTKQRAFEKKVEEEGYNPGLRRRLNESTSLSSFKEGHTTDDDEGYLKELSSECGAGDEGLIEQDLVAIFQSSADHSLIGDASGRYYRRKNINAKYRDYLRED